VPTPELAASASARSVIGRAAAMGQSVRRKKASAVVTNGTATIATTSALLAQ
jgi:hypothetical protein